MEFNKLRKGITAICICYPGEFSQQEQPAASFSGVPSSPWALGSFSAEVAEGCFHLPSECKVGEYYDTTRRRVECAVREICGSGAKECEGCPKWIFGTNQKTEDFVPERISFFDFACEEVEEEVYNEVVKVSKLLFQSANFQRYKNQVQNLQIIDTNPRECCPSYGSTSSPWPW